MGKPSDFGCEDANGCHPKNNKFLLKNFPFPGGVVANVNKIYQF